MPVKIPGLGEPFVIENRNNSIWYNFFNLATVPLLRLLSGTSSTAIRIGGTLKTDTTITGNVGGGTDDLISYELPSGILAATNDMIEIFAWGTTAANANAKTLTLKFEAATLVSMTGNANAQDWFIHAVVTRLTLNTQRSIAASLVTTGGAWENTTTLNNTIASDLSVSQTINCTGAGVATDDIRQFGLLITYHPASP